MEKLNPKPDFLLLQEVKDTIFMDYAADRVDQRHDISDALGAVNYSSLSNEESNVQMGKNPKNHILQHDIAQKRIFCDSN